MQVPGNPDMTCRRGHRRHRGRAVGLRRGHLRHHPDKLKITAGVRGHQLHPASTQRTAGRGRAPAGWSAACATPAQADDQHGHRQGRPDHRHRHQPELDHAVPDQLRGLPGAPERRRDHGPAAGYAAGGLPVPVHGEQAEGEPDHAQGRPQLPADAAATCSTSPTRKASVRAASTRSCPPVMCAADFAILGLTQSPGDLPARLCEIDRGGRQVPPVQRPGPDQRRGVPHRVGQRAVRRKPADLRLLLHRQRGHGHVDGGELQFTGRAMGFTVNANLAYDNARYSETVDRPARARRQPRPGPGANKGDNLGMPDWTANLGLQYDTQRHGLPGLRPDRLRLHRQVHARDLGSARPAYNAAPVVRRTTSTATRPTS